MAGWLACRGLESLSLGGVRAASPIGIRTQLSQHGTAGHGRGCVRRSIGPRTDDANPPILVWKGVWNGSVGLGWVDSVEGLTCQQLLPMQVRGESVEGLATPAPAASPAPAGSKTRHDRSIWRLGMCRQWPVPWRLLNFRGAVGFRFIRSRALLSNLRCWVCRFGGWSPLAYANASKHDVETRSIPSFLPFFLVDP